MLYARSEETTIHIKNLPNRRTIVFEEYVLNDVHNVHAITGAGILLALVITDRFEQYLRKTYSRMPQKFRIIILLLATPKVYYPRQAMDYCPADCGKNVQSVHIPDAVPVE